MKLNRQEKGRLAGLLQFNGLDHSVLALRHHAQLFRDLSDGLVMSAVDRKTFLPGQTGQKRIRHNFDVVNGVRSAIHPPVIQGVR